MTAKFGSPSHTPSSPSQGCKFAEVPFDSLHRVRDRVQILSCAVSPLFSPVSGSRVVSNRVAPAIAPTSLPRAADLSFRRLADPTTCSEFPRRDHLCARSRSHWPSRRRASRFSLPLSALPPYIPLRANVAEASPRQLSDSRHPRKFSGRHSVAQIEGEVNGHARYGDKGGMTPVHLMITNRPIICLDWNSELCAS